MKGDTRLPGPMLPARLAEADEKGASIREPGRGWWAELVLVSGCVQVYTRSPQSPGGWYSPLAEIELSRDRIWNYYLLQHQRAPSLAGAGQPELEGGGGGEEGGQRGLGK